MKSFINNLFGNSSEVGGYSIQGRKPSQQDAWYISTQNKNGQLILVADGVGGHAHGEFASKLCVEIFQSSFEQKNESISDIPQYLHANTLQVANEVWQKSQSDSDFRNCGTTLSAFIVQKKDFYFVHIGDSRIYLLDRSDNLHQLSRDQTIVQRLFEQGEISRDEMATYPQKNVMYSAIGQEPSSIQIDIRGPEIIRSGETLLAFSDGIHDALSDHEIHTLLIHHKKDRNLAKLLVQAAYDAGGKDNITACFYRQ